MKKLFLSLVAVMAATVSFAQNTLVATLSHGEDISMYYGTYALRDAMNAAASGDVINLSGGAFQAVDITKGVTLRGTGIDDAAPTYFTGNFTINVPSEDANRLSMEGIRCTGTISMKGTCNSIYLLKCQFYRFEYNSSSAIRNTIFVDCKITGDKFSLYGNCSVQFINSYVSGFNNNSENTATASFLNCVIKPTANGSGYNYAGYIKSSQLLNCIVCFNSSSKTSFPATTIILNCLSVNYTDAFRDSQINRDCKYASFAEVFKDYTGAYSDDQTFELTDEAKTTFLGDDGTEMGIYGGVMPYTSTPSYPQITTMNVANKTTADGKLSVEIVVSAAE